MPRWSRSLIDKDWNSKPVKVWRSQETPTGPQHLKVNQNRPILTGTKFKFWTISIHDWDKVVFLKLWPTDLWRYPKTFQVIHNVKTVVILLKQYLPFHIDSAQQMGKTAGILPWIKEAVVPNCTSIHCILYHTEQWWKMPILF